jgi:hypothetical protein
MFGNELRKPLKRRSLWERLWLKRPGLLPVVASSTALAVASLIIWTIRTPYPFAGEPVLVMAVPPAQEMTTGSTSKPDDNESLEEPAPSENDAAADPPAHEEIPDTGDEPDITVIKPDGQEVTETDSAIIIAPRRTLAAAPIAVVSEQGPYGILPKIGPNNKKPSTVYARTVPQQAIISDAPKIAIVLGGMGLNTDLTRKATSELPGEVTFAFAPYGDDLQAQVNKARAGGHEVMLQLPMEPFGYPAVNPGPKTILAGADTNTNLDALAWHMGRFAGYTGIVNYMGAKVLAEPQPLHPILAELKRRGLIFLGDGSAARNMAGEVGKAVGLPVRSANVTIDSNPDPQAIASQLQQLEDAARQNGIAIGSGTGLDVTIDAVGDWAKTLAERGIVLIPVSAAYKGRAS